MSTVHYADPSDIQLRHALANLIAVTFSLPLKSTHLWYFLFDQSELEDTYLPGFRVSLTGRCTVFVINVTHQVLLACFQVDTYCSTVHRIKP